MNIGVRLMQTGNDRPRTAWGVQLACYLLLATVFIYVGLERWRRPYIVGEHPGIESERISQVETRIDPNVATWAELARLPDVGETLAREIVAYREGQRSQAGTPTTAPTVIFRSLKDLDPVPGIGEKKLKRMAPYLKFPE